MVNPGIISIDLEALRINEELEAAIIPIIRTEGSDGTVLVDYSINDGTATGEDDFTATSGTLTFTDGQTSKEIVVPILDDTIPETDETFSIAIGNSVGAELGGIRTAIVTIADNDETDLNTISFSQGEYNLGEEQGEASITLTRTGDTNQTVSVDYSTEDDYARSGADYTRVSGTLTFGPGETNKTFTVPLLDDSLPELDEALNLTLSNPNGIDLGVQNTAKLIIGDNDESPFNFEREIVVSGLAEGNRNSQRLSGPTAFDWTPNGKMLIAKLDGIVRVLDNGELLEQPFIDISEQVNTGGQRGLLGLAVHPEFPENPYVYLAFSYDPPEEEPDQDKVGRVTRLIRVEADPNSNYTTALPGSEVILLETPPVNNFHAAGAIHFGNDGSLFFSHGDGSQVSDSPTPEETELLQSVDYPFGKLFRLDPITGEGYPDNPFYDGDVNSIQSKVYNYGLRNPWRYTIHPDTGEPVVGDVGWTNWEEINTGRGVNFGWPLYEGGNGVNLRTTALSEDPEFQELYDSTSDVTAPIYALNHSDGARSITLGDFYTGTTYPEVYQGALFFNDFGNSAEVNALLFDDQGNIDSATPFTEELNVTQISMGPDSNLYFSTLFGGEIGRWVVKNSFLPGKPDYAFPNQPSFSDIDEAGVFLWKDYFDGPYHLRTVGDGDPTQFVVNLIANDSLQEVTPFSLETNDLLDVNESSFSFASRLGKWQDGVDFHLRPGTEAIFSVTQDGVANPQQVNVGQQGSRLSPSGWIVSSDELPDRPEFSSGEDLGLFWGQGDNDDLLEFRWSGDGDAHDTKLSVLAADTTSSFTPVLLGPNDKVTNFTNGIEIEGQVGTGHDGLDITTTEPTKIGVTYEQDGLFQPELVNPLDNDLLGVPNGYQLPLATPYGRPEYDPTEDEEGIFLWLDEQDFWHLRMTGSDSGSRYLGSITSDQAAIDVQNNQLEETDVVNTADPLRIDFEFQVASLEEDGIDFRFQPGTSITLNLEQPGGDAAALLKVGEELWSVSELPLDLSGW